MLEKDFQVLRPGIRDEEGSDNNTLTDLNISCVGFLHYTIGNLVPPRSVLFHNQIHVLWTLCFACDIG